MNVYVALVVEAWTEDAIRSGGVQIAQDASIIGSIGYLPVYQTLKALRQDYPNIPYQTFPVRVLADEAEEGEG